MKQVQETPMTNRAKPKLGSIPMSLRIPEDIAMELPFIAVFNHKTSGSEQMREWIVMEASKVLDKEEYKAFKEQMKQKKFS